MSAPYAWGNSTRQRLRLMPLALALRAADAIARRLRMAPRVPPVAAHAAGISVVIPERGTPAHLGQALASVFDAARLFEEPLQVIVMVNGTPLR